MKISINTVFNHTPGLQASFNLTNGISYIYLVFIPYLSHIIASIHIIYSINSIHKAHTVDPVFFKQHGTSHAPAAALTVQYNLFAFSLAFFQIYNYLIKFSRYTFNILLAYIFCSFKMFFFVFFPGPYIYKCYWFILF